MNADLKFDVVACLNLLDRCDKPLTILSDIKHTLQPVTGRLLVAVVLPFKPCVESGWSIVFQEQNIYYHLSKGSFRVSAGFPFVRTGQPDQPVCKSNVSF